MAITLNESDLVLRVSNDSANRHVANTFATYAEIENVVKFRIDRALWEERADDERIRAIVTAYEDCVRLPFTRRFGRAQSVDYGWIELFSDPPVGECPLEDPEFMFAIKKCQAIQAMFILGGTQIRDMTREGVLGSRAVAGRGQDTFFSGYRGPVCVEAMEIIGRYVNLSPSMRRYL